MNCSVAYFCSVCESITYKSLISSRETALARLQLSKKLFELVKLPYLQVYRMAFLQWRFSSVSVLIAATETNMRTVKV